MSDQAGRPERPDQSDASARADDRCAELEQDLREMANALSHDLRAPLRAIDGFSRALVDECQAALTPRGQQYLGWIGEAVQGMGRQIEAMVALARLSIAEVRWQRLDLTLLAQQITAGLQAAERDRTVQLEITPDMTTDGDARLMGVVLESLLQNAWAFTRGRGAAHVTVGQLDRDGARVFFVRDDGIGFEPRQVERLFQPFCRLHAADQAPVGLGMGLCKARRALGRMGGRLWAEGRPGQGATFFFTVGPSPVAGSPA